MQVPQPQQQSYPNSSKVAYACMPASLRTKVAITETYHIAATCRLKLGREADRSDLELRRLVCHANMLDGIMERLMRSEQEYQAFLSSRACTASLAHKRPAKLQWMDTIAEELGEEAEQCEDKCTDASEYRGHVNSAEHCKRQRYRIRSPPPKSSLDYFDELDDPSDGGEDDSDKDGENDEEYCNTDLTLRRIKSSCPVPELTFDVDSGSEEDEAPPIAANNTSLSCEIRRSPATIAMSKASVEANESGAPLHLVVVIK